MWKYKPFAFALLLIHVSSLSPADISSPGEMTRRSWYKTALSSGFAAGWSPNLAFAAQESPSQLTTSIGMTASLSQKGLSQVAYRSISLPLPEFGVNIPVACWFPVGNLSSAGETSNIKYNHQISVKRIGQLLAGWEFIPDFASRKFSFTPTTSSGFVANGDAFPLPPASNVVFLSHGFLGSRFDLSHIAEDLAENGFVCVSPEYPESLAASYERAPGLDRAVVNDELLRYVNENMKPKSYGVVGHSLGCGTALRIGDASWARVLIAGRAPEETSSPLLFISSMNDGTVRFTGPLTIPSSYAVLHEDALPVNIPRRAALVFDRPDAPNHISYLSENVNDAMVSFLSPLLPVAQALSIPVLDFDRYQLSRDSKETAAIVKPLISSFLLQQMTASSE